MFLFVIIFFIVFVVSYVYLIYKLKLQDDEIESLYDKYAGYIENSFKVGKKNGWYIFRYVKRFIWNN